MWLGYNANFFRWARLGCISQGCIDSVSFLRDRIVNIGDYESCKEIDI